MNMNQDNAKSTICDDYNVTQMGTSPAQNNRDDSPDSEQIRGQTFFKEIAFSPPVSIHVYYRGKNKIYMEKGGAALRASVSSTTGNWYSRKSITFLESAAAPTSLSRMAIGYHHKPAKCPDELRTHHPSCSHWQGVTDLFWMPVSELRRENGHVVTGLQNGVRSFGLSSAAGTSAMSNVCRVGSLRRPDSAYLNKRNGRIRTRPAAPTDLPNGFELAYIVSDTKTDLELAAQEDRATGNSSFRQVLLFATPAVIRPLVIGSQISHQILGGLRNQLNTDMYQDERQKWTDDEVPGDSG